MAATAAPVWDEHQAYEELLYWDSLIQQGHRLHPHDFDRYEELRYWYDCLCYEEELRQYHDYIAAIEHIEDKRYREESAATHTQAGPYDRYVLAKHSEVYPSTEELEAVQTIVSHVECALKTVSDQMDAPKDDEANTEAQSEDSQERVLRGVMRVGLVAKGLLLKGDKNMELVLLCSNKPTVTLLKQVAEKLSAQLETISPETYTVSQCPGDAAIVVTSTKESVLTLIIHLTSPLVRTVQESETAEEEAEEEEGAYVGPALICVVGMQALYCSTDLLICTDCLKSNQLSHLIKTRWSLYSDRVRLMPVNIDSLLARESFSAFLWQTDVCRTFPL